MKLQHLLPWLGVALAAAGCDGGKKTTMEGNSAAIWKEVSGEKALHHVQQLVELGPRPAGSDALEKSRLYLTEKLEAAGWRVTRQTFQQATPEGELTFVNLIAVLKDAKAPPSFILCTHYDTKLFKQLRFVGANDGGSGTGLLLELARVFGQHPEVGEKLQLVFFDGEEAFVSFTDSDGLYGSRYFARQLAAEGKAKQFRGGILFDMVGDRYLDITLPPDSPSEITLGIFAAAEAQGERSHFTYASGGILDDHTPLNEIGIPTIDLIDFDYPPWHTAEDTIDKLSAESLAIVGQVAVRYLVEQGLK